MSGKILTKAILLAPLAALLISPFTAPAKEKPIDISLTNNSIIAAKKTKYDEVKEISFEIKAVKYKGKWGFINHKGKKIIDFKYDDIWKGELTYGSGELVIAVKKDGKWGFINEEGKETVSLEYEDIKGAMFIGIKVKKDGKWGLIGKNGEVKGKIEFDSIFNDEGMSFIRVNLDGGTGYIDRAGKIVIPVKYDEVINYNDEAVVVRLKKKWGVYDSTGKIAVPIKYDLIDNVNIYHDDKKESIVYKI